MNYSKLRGAIREKFHTEGAFAAALGISAAALSNKLNNKDEWRGSEIAQACDLLGIQPDQIAEYFFTPKVAK